MQVSTWMGDHLVVLFLLIWDRISLTPRSEALPFNKLYACVSSNSLSDSSETTSLRIFRNNGNNFKNVFWTMYLCTNIEICTVSMFINQ